MAGIYVHIPFCRKACAYCNFHFDTNLSGVDSLVNSLLVEISLRKEFFKTSIETIYFGGGTPSVLNKEQFKKILNALQNTFDCSQVREYTLEVNPEDVTKESLHNWYSIGFNRLSMGVQSFFDNDLVYMGRFHSENQSFKAIELIRESDFTNYSIDLIYGMPKDHGNNWEQNLEIAARYNFPHISAYALTIEPQTKLEYRVRKGKLPITQDEKTVKDFSYLQNWAKEQGYEHYELSNLAKPSFKAMHNSNYWKFKPYLGLGPGAHSYLDHNRFWNISNNKLYIDSLTDRKLNFESEKLTEIDLFNELLMVSLRTKKGLSKKQLSTFSLKIQNHFEKSVSKQKDISLLNDSYTIPPEKWMLSDAIISDLFMI
jgi:oxygen-independent coproporphyrinogen-3 oxidase